jgi:hypothetical protein
MVSNTEWEILKGNRVMLDPFQTFQKYRQKGMVVPCFAAREGMPVIKRRVIRYVSNRSPTSKFIAALPPEDC